MCSLQMHTRTQHEVFFSKGAALSRRPYPCLLLNALCNIDLQTYRTEQNQRRRWWCCWCCWSRDSTPSNVFPTVEVNAVYPISFQVAAATAVALKKRYFDIMCAIMQYASSPSSDSGLG